MYKILLCCSAGITTNMLVNSIKNEAENQNVDVMVWAVAESAINLTWADADVILLAPQTRSDEPKILDMVKGSIPVEMINGIDFSTMNGKNVLKQAIDLIKNK